MDTIPMTQSDYDALMFLIERVGGKQGEARLQMGESHSANAGDGWHSDDFKRTIVDEAVQGQRLAELQDFADRAEIVTPEEQNIEVQLGSVVVLKYEDGTRETLLLVGFACRNLGDAVQEVSLRAPSAKLLLGKRYGDEVTLGNKKAKVLDILSPSESAEFLAGAAKA
jgi:transcription elongation GreA/GreB family factor